MKRLLTMILVLGIALSAGAQGKIRGGNFHPRPRVIVVAPSYGYSPFGYRASPFYNPYNSFYYSPFNDPYYRTRTVETTPSELQLDIDRIESDYAYQISQARDNKDMSGKDRRAKVRELKHLREMAVIDAKRNYYKKAQ